LADACGASPRRRNRRARVLAHNARAGAVQQHKRFTMQGYLSVLISILAGLVGSYLTYYFAMKSKKHEAITRFKEEKYAKLLLTLQGFMGSTANAETKRAFFQEQYQAWLYCSDEVVLAINNLVDLVKRNYGKTPNPEEGRRAVGGIVLAMRKDLLGRTSLNYEHFVYTEVREW
jgi:hypothetical protein